MEPAAVDNQTSKRGMIILSGGVAIGVVISLLALPLALTDFDELGDKPAYAMAGLVGLAMTLGGFVAQRKTTTASSQVLVTVGVMSNAAWVAAFALVWLRFGIGMGAFGV